MQINSNSFTEEVSKILGFDPPNNISPTKTEQHLPADFLSFDGGSGNPQQNIAEKNLLDRNGIVQTNLLNAFETNAANRNNFDYNSIQGVNGNRFVTAEFTSRVEAMAGRLGTRPEYILAVMSFESGGSFNPGIRNSIGATGLIQFLPSTARGLGTTTDALAQMSAVEQLRFVEKYFDQPNFRGRLGTLEGLYTAVLSGTAHSNADDVLFTRGTRAYEQNPFDWNRDGKITAGEAITPVAARLYGGVTRVQQRLVDAGFVPENQKRGFADGRWGQNTAVALARFQRANNLPATGLLDDRTGRALFNLANPAPNPAPTRQPIPASTLKEGNRGAQVRQLQNLLVRFGFMTQRQMNTGPGIFGNRTDSALKSFQRAAHLTADGIFGNNTRKAMRDIISGTGKTTEARNTNLTKGIQDRLVALGYLTRAQVNTGYGTLGPQTESAVKRFQARNGIRQTGIVGEQTFRTVFSDSAKRSGSTGGANNTGGTNGTGGNDFSAATDGRHYTVNQGILMTDALRQRLEQLADTYFQRTGQTLRVTSGYRPPARQAAAMYDLIVGRGESHVRNLYANKDAVDQILNAYRNNNGSRSGAVSAMTRTIENQIGRGIYISSHLRSRALDLSTATNSSVLRQIVGEMGGTVLNEGDHYHVEL
ncbi:MAG: peptidoglycan-binding protein [Pyrinomonadaceae bacterium]